MMRSYFFDRDHRIRFRVWGRRRRTSVIRLAPWLPTWPVKIGAHRVPAVGRVHRSSAPAPVRGALGSPRRLRGSLRRGPRGLETITASRSDRDRSPTLRSPLITDFVSRCFRRLAIYIYIYKVASGPRQSGRVQPRKEKSNDAVSTDWSLSPVFAQIRARAYGLAEDR